MREQNKYIQGGEKIQEYAETQGSQFNKLAFPNENNSKTANPAKLIEMK